MSNIFLKGLDGGLGAKRSFMKIKKKNISFYSTLLYLTNTMQNVFAITKIGKVSASKKDIFLLKCLSVTT